MSNSSLLAKMAAPTLIAFSGFIAPQADAGTILFRDDFSQTDTNYNQTVQSNTSLSGNVVPLMVQADPTYRTTGTLGPENGLAQIRNGGSNNAAFVPRFDFANNADIAAAGGFRVTLEGLTPPGGLNWVSINVFDSATPDGQNVTDSDLPLGVLFRGDSGSGEVFVWSEGSNNNPGTSTSNDPIDVSVEILNISGYGANQSFDYTILFDGVNVLDSGTITGVNTSTNFITIESWRGNGTIDAFVVEAIPSPTAAIAGLVGLGLLVGRRHRR